MVAWEAPTPAGTQPLWGHKQARSQGVVSRVGEGGGGRLGGRRVGVHVVPTQRRRERLFVVSLAFTGGHQTPSL